MLEMLIIEFRGVMTSWQRVAVSCFENWFFILLFYFWKNFEMSLMTNT